MKPGSQLLSFIASWESFRAHAYLDRAGVWTIGYGTTRIYDLPVTQGMTINEPVGALLLYAQVSERMAWVDELITAPMTAQQRDAFTSLIYNIGRAGFADSTIRRQFNAGHAVLRDYFTRWNKATDPVTKKKVVLDGLTRRRNAEYDIFAEGVYRLNK